MAEYVREQRKQESRVITNSETGSRQLKEIVDNRNCYAEQMSNNNTQFFKKVVQRDMHPNIKKDLLTIKDNQLFTRAVSQDEAAQIRKAGTLVQIIAAGGSLSKKCIWVSKSGASTGIAKRSGDHRVTLNFKMNKNKNWFTSKIIDNEESDGKETGHDDNIIAKGAEPGNYGIGLNLKNLFILQ